MGKHGRGWESGLFQMEWYVENAMLLPPTFTETEKTGMMPSMNLLHVKAWIKISELNSLRQTH